MSCLKNESSDTLEFFKELEEKVLNERIPITGSIDLTHRCNLRCIHCYNGNQSEIHMMQSSEMETSKIKAIVDEIVDAGCLYILITGGEPLLRKDFKEIYRYIKLSGLITTIFTNGTLINDDIIELFNELPPHEIEITLYGAKDETYGKITGNPECFQRCINGIRRLVENGHNVGIKTILMTLNSDEFFEIKKIASDLNVRFRFDPALFPRFDGDKTPISLRVSPEDAIEKEMSEPGVIEKWKDYFNKNKDFVNNSNDLYICGAGVTSFHIDPYGNLKPCLMIQAIKCSLINNSFQKAWDDIINKIRLKKAKEDYKCNKCKMSILCGYCPSFFELEKGKEELCSEYLCEMGRLRYKKIILN